MTVTLRGPIDLVGHSDAVAHGRIHQLNVSNGGVPKLAVDEATVWDRGLVGDRQGHPRIHGKPHQALCLLGLDVIERLRAEGHPIEPGSTGENVTVAGLDWALVVPGVRLRLGADVVAEVSGYTVPCRQIAGSFRRGDFSRLHADEHPGDSRVYAWVRAGGVVRVGDPVVLDPA